MAATSSLLSTLRSALPGAWGIATKTSLRASCLYELYIFKLVLEAAETAAITKSLIADITFWDGLGRYVSPTTLVTGPHKILAPKYIRAEIRFPGSRKRALEVHTGVKFEGKSGVEHECDVAVFGHTEGDRCRRKPVLPRYHKILLAVECKLYSRNIDLGMSREFVGLTNDLTVPDDNNFYVVSSFLVPQGRKLIKYHEKNWSEDLLPSNVTAVNTLRKSFEDIFEAFIG